MNKDLCPIPEFFLQDELFNDLDTLPLPGDCDEDETIEDACFYEPPDPIESYCERHGR